MNETIDLLRSLYWDAVSHPVKHPQQQDVRDKVKKLLDLNSGKSWSEMDINDLKAALDAQRSLRRIADELMRDESEVRAKIEQLGLRLP